MSVKMRIGDMKTRARVQKPTETRDAEGGVTRTWATFRKVWCKVIGKGGDEFLHESQMNTKTVHKVFTRWTNGITTGHRLVIRDKQTGTDRVLNISSVVDINEEHVWLVLLCNEATDG